MPRILDYTVHDTYLGHSNRAVGSGRTEWGLAQVPVAYMNAAGDRLGGRKVGVDTQERKREPGLYSTTPTGDVPVPVALCNTSN